jgi:tetrapyrrole methylase family protein/MazG family protein
MEAEIMVNFISKNQYGFDDLLQIMTILRHECPWDMEQTHESIRRDTLEEAYETAEAIDLRSVTKLREELGDLLLQVVFHTEIEREKGSFDIGDVCDGICKKLILRHPHVFADTKADTSVQVLENWDRIKTEEKGFETYAEEMNAVARTLPALWRAEKVQKKSQKAGFDFPNAKYTWDKLYEEAEELKAADNVERAEEEIGDLLFSAVGIARAMGVDPEAALGLSCDKFIARYEWVERELKQSGRTAEELSAEERTDLWRTAKLKSTGIRQIKGEGF